MIAICKRVFDALAHTNLTDKQFLFLRIKYLIEGCSLNFLKIQCKAPDGVMKSPNMAMIKCENELSLELYLQVYRSLANFGCNSISTRKVRRKKTAMSCKKSFFNKKISLEYGKKKKLTMLWQRAGSRLS